MLEPAKLVAVELIVAEILSSQRNKKNKKKILDDRYYSIVARVLFKNRRGVPDRGGEFPTPGDGLGNSRDSREFP